MAKGPNISLQRTSSRRLAAAELRSLGSVMKIVAIVVAFAAPCCVRAAEPRGAAGVIAFVETSPEGQPVRELAFDLTDETAKTCISGTWKAARVVKDPEHYTRNPAYTLEKGRIEVLLINGPCDSYDSYIGELTDRRFKGDHVAYGLRFHKTLGKVTGEYSK